jgi:hypothetical protein
VRRLPAITGLAALLALVTMPFMSVPALATAPRDQGWWTSTNPLPAPPDVPTTGLLIQGGPNAPSAFAALLYELDPGVTASTLTLTVAPNSLTTPTAAVELCGLMTPIVHADQGGPMSDAPAYNCGKNVIATPDSSGKSYKFDVSGMVTDNLVAVALLPNSPVERVVLSAPDGNSLATQQTAGAGASSSADTGAAFATSEPSVGLPSDVPASSPLAASALAGDAALPSVGAGPSSSPAAAAGPAGASNLGGAFVPAASSTPTKATPLLVVLFVAAAVGCAALWFYAGRHRDRVSGPSPS